MAKEVNKNNLQKSTPDATTQPLPIYLQLSRDQWTVVLFVIGIILYLIFGWIWYNQIFSSPERVFWKMVDNNLGSRGVTRTVTEGSNGADRQQIIQVSFNGLPQARTLLTINQGEKDNASTVTSEALGTTTADYIRYTVLKPNTKKSDGSEYNFSAITGQWGKRPFDKDQQSTFLTEALFSIVPTANLPYNDRKLLVNVIKKAEVYGVDYANISRERNNGRLQYKYPVTLDLQKYFILLNDYLKRIGVQPTQIDPKDYQDKTSEVFFTIDVLSHQLRKITYKDSNREEVYSGYGVIDLAGIPPSSIAVEDLQKKLDDALGGS